LICEGKGRGDPLKRVNCAVSMKVQSRGSHFPGKGEGQALFSPLSAGTGKERDQEASPTAWAEDLTDRCKKGGGSFIRGEGKEKKGKKPYNVPSTWGERQRALIKKAPRPVKPTKKEGV